MFPHVVTIFNAWEDEDLQPRVNVTILGTEEEGGVLLDISKGTNIAKTGLINADEATLYIPFNAAARATDGTARRFVSPREYYRAEDKNGLWTLDEGGQSNSTATYFAKGEIREALTYKEARQTLDHVYDVTAVDIRDFGGDMQHWQVSGK